MFEYKHPVIRKEIFFISKKIIKYTCNVCVATSEYCRIGSGVAMTGCLIGSGSVFVVDDCCLSRSGDDGLITEGAGGGSDGGGITVGISTGIEGKNEGAGDILIRFVTCKMND